MPLTRAPGVVKVDLNEIAFPMSDAASGVTVECRVSEDALRKLSGGGSSISSLEAMFEQHREAVEDLASHKYDLGHASPHVRGSDAWKWSLQDAQFAVAPMTDFLRLSGLGLLGLSLFAHPAVAQDIRSYTKTAPFEDVKFELTNAIINRGLVIDYTGQIGKMVERTGVDVGSTKPLYAQAEFLTFCSAKLSRAMMEAELSNVGFCPYVVFIYEAAGKPGETVVGYRRPSLASSSEASKKALADIDALLDGIAKDAVK